MRREVMAKKVKTVSADVAALLFRRRGRRSAKAQFIAAAAKQAVKLLEDLPHSIGRYEIFHGVDEDEGYMWARFQVVVVGEKGVIPSSLARGKNGLIKPRWI
jgi:hypothetical protein